MNTATYNVSYNSGVRKFTIQDDVTNSNFLFSPAEDLPYYANGFNFYGRRNFEFYDLEGRLIDPINQDIKTEFLTFKSNFVYTFFAFNSFEACLFYNFTPLGFDDATPSLNALFLNALMFEPVGLSKVVISDATCNKIELIIDYNNLHSGDNLSDICSAMLGDFEN